MISEEVEHTQKTIPQPPSSFSSLPDELTETILARVSRWNYPSLSLVSKRFHSLLSSIHKTRSRIGAQEICFYVCLWLPRHPYRSWFSLWTKPNQTLTKQSGENTFKRDSSGNSVVPIPFSSSHPPHVTDNPTVTVGSEIYIIGGPYAEPSSSVRILDCRSHTWRDAPNMTVAREDAPAFFHDEKIYVMGGCDVDEYSANWFEVFDMKTQSWTAMPGPGDDDDELRNLLRKNRNYSINNVFEGKLCVLVGQKRYKYELKHGTWEFVEGRLSFLSYNLECWCWIRIENVIYGCNFSGDLMWSDLTKRTEWREIKGLQELHEYRTTASETEMEDYGGKLLVMWNISDTEPKNKIRYAKIYLESRCNGAEVWGEVECVDELTFPCEEYESFDFLSVLV